MTTPRHTCPRREENGMHDPTSPFVGAGELLDTYTKGHGLVGQGRGCSYCGSMEPEEFMNAIRFGAELEPTDKNYKAYIQGWVANGPNGGKFYYQHLSKEQRTEFVKLLNGGSVKFGWPGRFTVLPYFITVEAK